MTQFVRIRNTETEAVGTCPVKALPYWEAKGHEAIDDDEVAKARELDGITAGDVEQAEASAPFDPASRAAREVKEYLTNLDRSSSAGQAEYDRVVAAEQAAHNDGAGRSTALPTS